MLRKTLFVTALMCCETYSVAALANKFSATADVDMAYDDNYFKRQNVASLQPGLSLNEFSILPSLALEYEHLLGNQSAYADAKIGHKFLLLNTGFSVTQVRADTGLRYNLGSACHGDIGGVYTRGESAFEENLDVLKNIKSDYAVRLNSNSCNLGPRLSISLTGGYETIGNDTKNSRRANLNSYDIEGSTTYSNPVLGNFTLGGGYSHNLYPNRFATPISSQADKNSIITGFLGFHRERGGRLVFDIKAGITKLNTPVNVPSFLGFTGSVDIDWKPSSFLEIHPVIFKRVTPSTESISNSIREKGADFDLTYTSSSRLSFVSSNKITNRVQSRQVFGPLLQNFTFRPEITTLYATNLKAVYQFGLSTTLSLGGTYAKRTSALADRNYSSKKVMFEISFKR